MNSRILWGLFLLLPFSASWAAAPAGSVYLDGEEHKTALILCHGRGKHPRWKVVDPLREGIHKTLGYHTLSLQMPNENKPWREYAEDFPEAYQRIEAAMRFLREERDVERVVLLGHSMGARMAAAYLADRAEPMVDGLIIIGCRNNGDGLLNCRNSVADLTLPVLDLWGGGNANDVRAAAERESLLSRNYSQQAVPGAGHKFDGYEQEMLELVVDWLERK